MAKKRPWFNFNQTSKKDDGKDLEMNTEEDFPTMETTFSNPLRSLLFGNAGRVLPARNNDHVYNPCLRLGTAPH